MRGGRITILCAPGRAAEKHQPRSVRACGSLGGQRDTCIVASECKLIKSPRLTFTQTRAPKRRNHLMRGGLRSGNLPPRRQHKRTNEPGVRYTFWGIGHAQGMMMRVRMCDCAPKCCNVLHSVRAAATSGMRATMRYVG